MATQAKPGAAAGVPDAAAAAPTTAAAAPANPADSSATEGDGSDVPAGPPAAEGSSSAPPPPQPPQQQPRTAAERNRIKKLTLQYREILALEEQRRVGLPPLNADQAAKVERKAAVAGELQQLGASVPSAPAAPAGSTASLAGAFGGMSMAGAGERLPQRPPTPALLHQQSLARRQPGFAYFLVLPDPLPDVGVKLADSMGALFFEVMRGRAEGGDPTAVKMMFDQLMPSLEQYGLPAMQLRLQLLVEYGCDPVTLQPFEGTDQQALAWLESTLPAAEVAQARRQLESAAKQMVLQQMGMGGTGGGGGRRAGGGSGRGRR